MKLILSSCDFKNEKSKKCIIDNLPKPIKKCRVLFIPNEKASKKAIRSDKFYLRLEEYGFERDNIYVFDYYDADAFYNLEIDILYISGGNTFQTFDRIRKRGFDKEISRYINSGVIFIGGSAGAHIVSKNIEHILEYDENTANMTDFDGLGFLDGILICHFSPERQVHYDQLAANGKYKVYALTNSDSLVVTINKNCNYDVKLC